MNAFYECRLVSGDPQPDDDVAELRWFARDELPPADELAFAGVRAAFGRVASPLRAARRARAGAG